MMHEPKRLLDDATTEAGARALLAAARRVAPVPYDAARGAARLRVALESAGAALGASELHTEVSGVERAGSALGAGGQAAAHGAVLWKGALLLLPLATALIIGYRVATPAPSKNDLEAAHAARPVLASAQVGEQPSIEPIAPTTQAGTRAKPADDEPVRPPRALVSSRRAVALPQADAPAAVRDDVPRSRAAPRTHAARATRAVVEPANTALTTHVSRGASAPRRESEKQSPAAEPRPTAQPTSPPLDELRAVAEVRRLLAPNPRAALALLERLARERPQGYFLEEREALTILALAADGQQAAAERRAARFVETHANSPLIDRVRMVMR